MRGSATSSSPPASRSKAPRARPRSGQEEINIRYGGALETAENHAIAKHAAKEIGWQEGHAVSFLPKWHKDRVGSASHVHLSLWPGRQARLPRPRRRSRHVAS